MTLEARVQHVEGRSLEFRVRSQEKRFPLYNLQSSLSRISRTGVRTVDVLHWWVGLLVVTSAALLPSSGLAQTAIGGEMVEIYGTVQVEPGSNVLTLDVKGEEIRFAVHNLRSPDQRVSMARFLSDVKRRNPAMFVRGPEEMLDTLRKERPGKRVLRLRGTYYYDSRIFT